MRCPIAPQLAGHQASRFAPQAVRELAKKPLGCSPISRRLDEIVDDVTVLIDSASEILPPSLDHHKELTQVP